MKPPRFRYERPESLSAALQILDAEGERAKILAGGQSLVALMNLRLATPAVLVDIGRLEELRYVRESGQMLEVGALTTHATIESHPLAAQSCPMLAEAVGYIGHAAIRNRGTVGGSIAHADPAAELPLVLLALDGEVSLASSAGMRQVSGTEFFHGFLTTDVQPEEVITAVSFKAAGGSRSFAFEEFARRPGDFALVAVACTVERRDGAVCSARVAVGGVGQVPVLVHGLDDLGGLDDDGVARAVTESAARLETRADIHGTADYRLHLIRTLTKRAVDRVLRGGDARAR